MNTTKDIQSKFANYCRTGTEVELPGVTSGRINQYRRLVFNIINDNLESAFPIAYKYVDREIWDEIVHIFFSKHSCKSYQVWLLPKEFYDYVVKENLQEKYKINYLNDLLKFEWEEMYLYNMEDMLPEKHKTTGDLFSSKLVLNPEFSLLPLTYPIHIHPPIMAVDLPGQYYAFLYRERDTGKVQFMDISVWFAIVIEQLSASNITLEDLMTEAPKIFGSIDVAKLREDTLIFIKELKQKNFVLGFL